MSYFGSLIVAFHPLLGPLIQPRLRAGVARDKVGDPLGGARHEQAARPDRRTHVVDHASLGMRVEVDEHVL